MSAVPAVPRNPGPSWGFRFLLHAERSLPGVIFRPSLMLGAWVAMACMPAQRGCSRAYLEQVLGRPPRLVDVWRHFFAFTEVLLIKLRLARGVPHACRLSPEHAAGFEALIASGRPALFGTFHFGHSDLLGYLLGARGLRVTIIRLRVENSDDTRLLGEQFNRWVSFLWVNEPANVLFALKSAIDAGESIAMKCDRLDFSARTEPFQFLGRTRLFPFTIYHLAVLFDRPVMFCIGVPGAAADATDIFASPLFTPDPAASRVVNLARAREHFQGVLGQLETLLRQHPALWFNFLPLNPEAPASSSIAAAACSSPPPTTS